MNKALKKPFIFLVWGLLYTVIKNECLPSRGACLPMWVFQVVWWIIGGVKGIPATHTQIQNIASCSGNYIPKVLFLNGPMPSRCLEESEPPEIVHPGGRPRANLGPRRRGTKIGLTMQRSYLWKHLGEEK